MQCGSLTFQWSVLHSFCLLERKSGWFLSLCLIVSQILIYYERPWTLYCTAYAAKAVDWPFKCESGLSKLGTWRKKDAAGEIAVEWWSGCRLATLCLIPLLLLEERCRTTADCWETQPPPFFICFFFFLIADLIISPSDGVLEHALRIELFFCYYLKSLHIVLRRDKFSLIATTDLWHFHMMDAPPFWPSHVFQTLSLGCNCGAAGGWVAALARKRADVLLLQAKPPPPLVWIWWN